MSCQTPNKHYSFVFIPPKWASGTQRALTELGWEFQYFFLVFLGISAPRRANAGGRRSGTQRFHTTQRRTAYRASERVLAAAHLLRDRLYSSLHVPPGGRPSAVTQCGAWEAAPRKVARTGAERPGPQSGLRAPRGSYLAGPAPPGRQKPPAPRSRNKRTSATGRRRVDAPRREGGAAGTVRCGLTVGTGRGDGRPAPSCARGPPGSARPAARPRGESSARPDFSARGSRPPSRPSSPGARRPVRAPAAGREEKMAAGLAAGRARGRARSDGVLLSLGTAAAARPRARHPASRTLPAPGRSACSQPEWKPEGSWASPRGRGAAVGGGGAGPRFVGGGANPLPPPGRGGWRRGPAARRGNRGRGRAESGGGAAAGPASVGSSAFPAQRGGSGRVPGSGPPRGLRRSSEGCGTRLVFAEDVVWPSARL